MSTTIVVCMVALPFVGALHHFGMNYGYRGMDRSLAMREAWRVGVVLAVFSVLYAMVPFEAMR